MSNKRMVETILQDLQSHLEQEQDVTGVEFVRQALTALETEQSAEEKEETEQIGEETNEADEKLKAVEESLKKCMNFLKEQYSKVEPNIDDTLKKGTVYMKAQCTKGESKLKEFGEKSQVIFEKVASPENFSEKLTEATNCLSKLFDKVTPKKEDGAAEEEETKVISLETLQSYSPKEVKKLLEVYDLDRIKVDYNKGNSFVIHVKDEANYKVATCLFDRLPAPIVDILASAERDSFKGRYFLYMIEAGLADEKGLDLDVADYILVPNLSDSFYIYKNLTTYQLLQLFMQYQKCYQTYLEYHDLTDELASINLIFKAK